MQKDDKSLLSPEKTEQEKIGPQRGAICVRKCSSTINQSAIHEIIQLDAAAWLKAGRQ
ncbi:hypothetical protein [Ponticaulis koreensis]|uniref:hypothetical protein n=1 Tax=Ponticaulis koreensis TaxID=1123045 RepID=UPI0003B68480|nr:hypothetical protein [Ponticaulis koreensis]